MNINIKPRPQNKSKFIPGELIGIRPGVKPMDEMLRRFLVTGEDDSTLHTFELGTGKYYGWNKNDRALFSALVVYSPASAA